MKEQINQEAIKKQEPSIANWFTFRETSNISILYINIDMAMVRINTPKESIRERWPHICQKIHDLKPDIVCLLELRTIEDLVPAEMLKQINGYYYSISEKNPGKLAFKNVILWSYDKLVKLEEKQTWLSDTPNYPSSVLKAIPVSEKSTAVRGTSMISCKFILKDNEYIVCNPENNKPKEFWVHLTHYPLDPEEYKTAACIMTNEKAKEISNGLPFILLGDFNTGSLVDEIFQKQRNALKSGLIDCLEQLKILHQNEWISCKGTWFGFESDSWFKDHPRTVDQFIKNECHCLLDGVFSDKMKPKEIVLLNTYEDLETKNILSDHIPIYCNFVV